MNISPFERNCLKSYFESNQVKESVPALQGYFTGILANQQLPWTEWIRHGVIGWMHLHETALWMTGNQTAWNYREYQSEQITVTDTV